MIAVRARAVTGEDHLGQAVVLASAAVAVASEADQADQAGQADLARIDETAPLEGARAHPD